ncbi:MAG: hypothetical protein J6031_05695 [Bacteroidales bacterium]|nr:hypothetical protein [Bacteroidales bacterium]
MQISAGHQVDVQVGHRLGIVVDKTGIGIRLIGRVTHYPLVLGHKRAHAVVHLVVDLLGLLPLLELDNDDIVVIVAVCPRNDEIDPLGRKRYVVFDGDVHLVVDVTVIDNVSHELHRVLPRRKLPVRPCGQALFSDLRQNLVGDDRTAHIANEVPLGVVIDNHGRCTITARCISWLCLEPCRQDTCVHCAPTCRAQSA